MALLNLPVELLQRIIAETIPDSIENVAITCSTLYRASQIYLEQHNKLRRRYRHFSYSKLSRTSPSDIRAEEEWDICTKDTGLRIVNAVDFILAIIRNPLIPRYVETADLKASFGVRNFDPGDNSQGTGPLFPRVRGEADIEVLREFLRTSPYLEQTGSNPETWMEGIQNDVVGHAEVFLLTLLTHVRELALPAAWGELTLRPFKSGEEGEEEDEHRSDRSVIWPMLDHIVWRANEPGVKDAGLSKLDILRPFTGSGYDCRNAMTLNTPFLAIGSLREAYIGGCIALEDGYTGIPFHPEYSTYSPRLEKLELVGCTFEPWEVRVLLSRMANLKCLHFAYEVKWHGCGMSCDTGHILDTIMECTGETLEELSAWMMEHWGSTGRTLTDMKGFRRLKSLEIDSFMFMGPEFRKDDVEDFDLTDAPNVWPVEEIAAPRMVDMLPPSLESLRILVQGNDGDDRSAQIAKCLRALFDGFPQHRQKLLPKLQEVVVEIVGTNVDLNLQREMEAQGAKIYVREGLEVQPSFLTEFYTRFDVEAE
ncbi:hypothetical protein CORC01_10550 [Colletotrichum orchidophilum]|uniref:F-box domain-containing protein n=1 Tax=Colletotrichum orchidophilum TaxID=1209926 RepID=A0A1G4AYU8_9PEZI|nr:uncharacterized protein CORC01_10550 [Colletotrichum orchidophilum]OHE94212.1 hypothetical protein CORC01_10550 [Colletotrichum orchidophilum]